MMGQSMECWSTTSVHLVTVSVVEWIMIAVDVIVSTIMMMMIASVSVIGKVCINTCKPLCVRACVCMCVCVGVGACVCVCVCASVCVYAFNFIPSILLLGYLCGQCGNGKGVSALLSKCVSCGNASVLLIIALGRQYVVCIVHVCYNIIISHS